MAEEVAGVVLLLDLHQFLVVRAVDPLRVALALPVVSSCAQVPELQVLVAVLPLLFHPLHHFILLFRLLPPCPCHCDCPCLLVARPRRLLWISLPLHLASELVEGRHMNRLTLHQRHIRFLPISQQLQCSGFELVFLQEPASRIVVVAPVHMRACLKPKMGNVPPSIFGPIGMDASRLVLLLNAPEFLLNPRNRCVDLLAIVFVVGSLEDESFGLVDHSGNHDDHHFIREFGVVVDLGDFWQQLLDVGQVVEVGAEQDLLALAWVEHIVDLFGEFDHHSIIRACALHRHEQVRVLAGRSIHHDATGQHNPHRNQIVDRVS